MNTFIYKYDVPYAIGKGQLSMAYDIFRVTGRYMTGTEVTGYHLINLTNGASLIANRERAIAMVGRGQVENMRIQYNGDDVQLRGKGINLTKLPVYDMKSNSIRGQNNAEPQKQKNGLGRFTIVKRVMYKTACVGYVLTDASGKEVNISREKVQDMAIKGLIKNADAQRYTPTGQTNSTIVIRGVGCDLKSLPVVVIDKNGESFDTSAKSQNTFVRASRLNKAGILYTADGLKRTFESGDYIIVLPTGKVTVLKAADARSKLSPSQNKTALCDNSMAKIGEYCIEFYGMKKCKLSASIVLGWQVVEIHISK